jgi:hypothetical protein
VQAMVAVEKTTGRRIDLRTKRSGTMGRSIATRVLDFSAGIDPDRVCCTCYKSDACPESASSKTRQLVVQSHEPPGSTILRRLRPIINSGG